MDLFFDTEHELKYWGACPASCTKVVCSPEWPPVIAAVGRAPCIRAWEPVKNGRRVKATSTSQAISGVEFAPIEGLLEMDGRCFSTCHLTENILAAATCAPESKVVLWSTDSWQRLAVLQPGSTVACLALSGSHVAVGTADGKVHVWRKVQDDEWQPLFKTALTLDTLPLHHVSLTVAPDSSELMVVHSRGKNAVGVWRLADGKLVHRCEMRTTGEDPAAVAAANMVFMVCQGPMMAGVSHAEELGDPVLQVMHVLTREGSLLEAPDRLCTRGKPLCADYDSVMLAVGCEDGAVMTFGLRGWLRWHRGAVGAVCVLRGRGQVLSGCAAGELCLWDVEGCLLSTVCVGFQVTSLAGGEPFAAVGGAGGEVQMVAISAASDARGSEAPEKQRQPSSVTQYELHYDLRPARPLPYPVTSAPMGSMSWSTPGDVMRCFQVPYTTVTADYFRQLMQQHTAGKAGGTEEGGKVNSKDPGSGFNMKKALQGAKLTPEEEAAAAEAAKKQQLKQMGEGAGVARTSGKVLLPSSVELMGRKCDNPSCLARSGTTKDGASFARCSGCKQVWYCSVHCQRTHWRDAHSKQCKEWQKQQQQASTPAASTPTMATAHKEVIIGAAPAAPGQLQPAPRTHDAATVKLPASIDVLPAAAKTEAAGVHVDLDELD